MRCPELSDAVRLSSVDHFVTTTARSLAADLRLERASLVALCESTSARGSDVPVGAEQDDLFVQPPRSR